MPTTDRTMPAPSECTEPAPSENDPEPPALPIVFHPIAQATQTLRDQAMPPEEIEAVLDVSEPDLLRRYMELHRERLDERLAAERRALAEVERFLALAILERTDRAAGERGPVRHPANTRWKP